MNKELQILILEDRAVDAELMMFELRHNGIQFQAKRVWTEEDFVAELRNPALDLILADYSLPSFDGLSALKLTRQVRPELPFLLVSGSLGEELAVEALHNGATDYLLKQRPARLGPAVRRALREVAERNRRQRAEEVARRNEQNYREIFNATHEAIFVHDAATGEILDVNQTMLDMFGYTREDLSTLTGEAFRSTEPYTYQEAFRRMRLAVTAGPQVFEWLSRKKNGETFWSEVTLRATSIGGEGRVLAVVRDISERKRAEEALRKREADLRLAQQIGHIGSWEVDLDSNTLQWSDETYRIFGCDPDTFVPTREAFFELIHPDDRVCVQQAAGEALRTATAYQVEHRILRPDGAERIVAELALIQRDAQGQAARLMGTVQDITERQRAEEALAAEAARRRLLFERSRDGVVILDQAGKVYETNQSFARMLAYTLEEMPALHVWDWDTQWTREQLLGMINKLTPEGAFFETRHRRRDGTFYDVEVTTNLVEWSGQKLVFCVSRDITERKWAEESLLTAYVQQKLIVDVLRVLLEKIPLEQTLAKVLELVQAVPELALEQKGAIFLVEPGTETLVMTAQRNLTEPILAACARVPFGHCLCGRAAVSGQLEFSGDVDERHETHYEGMKPHGHYCVPMRSEGRTIGVINLYVKQGCVRDERVEQFLVAVANALTGGIERQRAEMALRESQTRFQQVAEHVGEWVWEVDANGLYTYSSPVGEKIHGHRSEDVVGKLHFYDLFPAEQRDELKQAALGAFARKLPFVGFKNYCLHKDGHSVLLETSGTPLLDAHGHLLGYRGVDTDITEHERAEKALRRSEKLQMTILDSVPVGVWFVNPRGEIQFSNSFDALLWSGQTAVSPGQVSEYKKWYRKLGQRVLDEQWAVSRCLSSLRSSFEEWHEIVCFDGKVRTILHSAVPLTDASSNELLGAVAINQDITERLKAEGRNRDQASLLNLTQDAIVVRNMDGCIQYWNKGCERMTGWTEAEAMGKSMDELVLLDPTAVASALGTLQEKGDWVGELQVTAKDGRSVTVLSRISLLRDGQGQPKSVLAINTDITEKKQLEAQFLRAQRLESIGQLAGGIAHDLNNILAPIMMIVPLLRTALKDPGASGLLDTVAQSAQRGADIVRQVLTFSRGLTGEKAPVQTRHLLKEMGKIVQETFPRSIQFKSRMPANLWLVEGDATQLHQVLMNLAVNARDAMPSGGVLTLNAENIVVDEALASRCHGAKAGPYVLWLVADTGTGMTADVLDRMFDPFFSTKPQGLGTGLGLSTTLGIVQGHGGFLQVESHPGEGTDFRVYLPAQQELEVLAHQPTTELPDGKGDLVLVVDDEESIRSVLQHTLETCGFKVVTAGDGVEAIAILQRRHREIALVLVDLMMPRLDGLAVIREAQRLDPALRIIAASGMCDDAQGAELQRLGVTHFLPKPFTSSSLATTLRTCLAEDANI